VLVEWIAPVPVRGRGKKASAAKRPLAASLHRPLVACAHGRVRCAKDWQLLHPCHRSLAPSVLSSTADIGIKKALPFTSTPPWMSSQLLDIPCTPPGDSVLLSLALDRRFALLLAVSLWP